jgi:vanillate O-demethylase monooxygenase subunit
MHDNLLDSSHFSYLHGGLLDSEDMAKSRFWSEDEGPILRLGREIPESISKGVVAAYFRVTPDHPYHRTMLCETILPAVSVGKQTIYDPADPSYPTRHLFAINALTPASRKSTHLFHVQVTSYEPEWTQQEMEGVRYIVEQDRIAVEAIQKRFEETGVEPTEISVKADHAGLLSRRKIQAMIREEQAGR